MKLFPPPSSSLPPQPPPPLQKLQQDSDKSTEPRTPLDCYSSVLTRRIQPPKPSLSKASTPHLPTTQPRETERKGKNDISPRGKKNKKMKKKKKQTNCKRKNQAL